MTDKDKMYYDEYKSRNEKKKEAVKENAYGAVQEYGTIRVGQRHPDTGKYVVGIYPQYLCFVCMGYEEDNSSCIYVHALNGGSLISKETPITSGFQECRLDDWTAEGKLIKVVHGHPY